MSLNKNKQQQQPDAQKPDAQKPEDQKPEQPQQKSKRKKLVASGNIDVREGDKVVTIKHGTDCTGRFSLKEEAELIRHGALVDPDKDEE